MNEARESVAGCLGLVIMLLTMMTIGAIVLALCFKKLM